MAPSLSDDHTNAVTNQLRVDRCDQGLHGEAGVYITRSEAPRAGPTQDRPDRTVATVTALLPGRTSPVPSNAAGATAASTGVVGATASVVPHSRAFGNPQVSGPTFRKIAGSGQRTLRLPGLPGHVGRAGGTVKED
jgi:hypothetical protein